MKKQDPPTLNFTKFLKKHEMFIDAETFAQPWNKELQKPYFEMLSNLESSHQKFEGLMNDDYENKLAPIIEKVNQQVEFASNNYGMHQADPVFDEVPTAILKMKMFRKEFKLEAEKHKKE